MMGKANNIAYEAKRAPAKWTATELVFISPFAIAYFLIWGIGC